jgi:Nif-specific regulatory protein
VTQLSLENTVGAFERDIIMDALKTTRGNRKRAAKLLNTTERVIGYKVRIYEIDCGRFRT